jgi:hypothetical protein
MTRVCGIGAFPPYTTATVSKIWNEPIRDTTSTSARIGRISGNVMDRNIRTSPAPSIAALS